MKSLAWGLWARQMVSFLSCCLLFLAVAAPASSDDRQTQALGQVTVGVPKSFPPYFQLDDDGRPSGFAIDVMSVVAKRAGLDITYRVKDGWGEALEALGAGTIDIIPSLGITERRKEFAAFSHPVETFRISLFVRSDTRGVEGLDDLAGRKVAVIADNAARQLLAPRQDLVLRVFDRFSDALFALLSANVDALAYPEPVTWKLAREARVDHRLKIAGEPLFEIKRGMAVRKDHVALLAVVDRAVREFVASPAYQDIYVAWFGKAEPFWTATRVAWTMGGVLAVLLLAMVWWRYRSGVRTIQVLHDSERRLRESEDLLNSVFENVPVGLLIKDPDHVVERANRTYLSWYGFDEATMAGRRSEEIEDFQSAEEAEFMNAQEREVFDTGLTKTRQVDRPFADGQIHTLSITKFPVYDRQRAITKGGSVSVDLTAEVQARKALAESETRFRDFAESSSDWFWEMDENLRFSYFSERASEVFGFDSSNNLGKTRREVTAEDADDEKWRLHYDDMENRRPFRDFHYDLMREDGSGLTISISGKPLFDEDGNFLGYRGTGTDITEQKRAEEMRDEALREAERANQAKSGFLATMSHEFRTPLNAILGFSEMLGTRYSNRFTDNDRMGYADAIHGAGQYMLTLVNDVLDISAIEAGKRTFVKTEIDLRRTLEDCVKDIDKAASDKDIDLSVDVPDGLPSLSADERSITQIVLNLLSNAVKFTEPRGTVTVSAGAANGKIVISVTDTGVGIPPDKLATIVEPFSQADADMHIAREGTGLGLSIVKSLVEAHDGTLEIASELKKGTTVTVEFPASAA